MYPTLAASVIDRVASTPLAYLLLWSGLVALSVSLVVLMRTGWGQSRPVQKCAVLSLLVHLLLACLAMTVKIVVGDGGPSAGPPIRVRLIEADESVPAVAMISPPPLLEREPPEPDAAPPLALPPADADNATPAQDESPKDATALTAEAASDEDQQEGSLPIEPTTVETQTDVAVSQPTQDQLVPTDVAANVVGATPPAEIDPEKPAEPAAPPAPTPVSNVTSSRPTGPYAFRTAVDRLRLVEEQGGNRQTEAAVAAALDWLATAQSPDGRWDADRNGAGVERRVLGDDRHEAGRDADTGMTALALLAFLGAGHTHLEGNYRPNVERGLEFLLRAQAADGNLFGGAGLYAQMYCHSMATFALAEAQAMTGDRRLAAEVSRAVGFCLRAQHPTTGGWRYEIGNKGDTSQLGWQTMALASGERAGMAVPLQTWTGIDRFLRSVRRGQFGGLASYQEYSPASTSMTAEALYCRLLLTEKLGGAIDERSAAEATRQLLASLPSAQPINLYYWYYATLALHHRRVSSDAAAAAWQAWNEALTGVLLDAQVSVGPDAGSWSPNTVWGGYGGRVYSTAMAAMCLEVYYRYASTPVQGQSSLATRPDGWQPSR